MEGWKGYILSLVSCSLVCGILSQLISDPKRKSLLRLICGTVLAVTIIRPLSKQNLEDILYSPLQNWENADYYIAEGERTVAEAMERCIKDSTEAYIWNKAKAMGTEIRVQVLLDEAGIPAFVEIRGKGDAQAEQELQKILMTDLAIPKENQKWIWNQEDDSSLPP